MIEESLFSLAVLPWRTSSVFHLTGKALHTQLAIASVIASSPHAVFNKASIKYAKRNHQNMAKEYQNYEAARQRSLHLLLGATAEVYRKHSSSPAQQIDVGAALDRSHAVNMPFLAIQKGPVSSLKGKTV